MFFIKKGIEKFLESATLAFKKHKGLLLVPSLVLFMWFPISSIIDAYLIVQYGILAIWWLCVDLYTTYLLASLIRESLKRLAMIPGSWYDFDYFFGRNDLA
ncbi:hypothetical protein [Coxiella burnetii]|nr:hypothetical protein [Coxiella burnetii]EAX32566.1 hypothetical protein A35_0043 [Coxiella burnetii 'MSU Goat Q177']